MSLHRITAGAGYDYLTRHVASADSTERGHVGLASYYTEKGEVPGVWVGSGMAGVDGLSAGDAVTAEQMQALFGSGHHPLAAERAAALAGNPEATEQDVLYAIRLGAPFKVYAGDISPFRVEVARRLEALNKAAGRQRDAAVGIEERARVRTEVGLEFFQREFGRAPLNQRELSGHIARLSRQQTTAVAGFDLTFSPVKSVSALWALADPTIAATIERAHQAAVADALRFIEAHALFTRTGTNGVRQVEVRGLIGAGFTHRDSRAGDPDLHTHVAIANKVQTLTDGRWLSIDSRVLHKAITAASETYNTSLEAHLTEALGVQFAARAGGDPEKRPVREIVGVEPALLQRWSARRHRIVARQAELAASFLAAHGRPPTPVEAIALAQQATLETREAKHEPRPLTEQRTTWLTQAGQLLGGIRAVRNMTDRALHPAPVEPVVFDQEWFEEAAQKIVNRVEQNRSAWQSWHVCAEASRIIRDAGVPTANIDAFMEWLTRRVLDSYSIPLSPPDDGPSEPDDLRRSNGDSVYTVAGSRLYTSVRILEAEQRIVANAGRLGGRTVSDPEVDLALLETAANGVELNTGQVMLVRDMATSGRRVQLAIAPAGSGKTTAMQALARAWTNSGGTILGLAPSAVAAAGLGDQIGSHADTLAKLAWHLTRGGPPAWMRQIGPSTLVIIDEAGMADTLSLDTVITHLLDAGASVRLIGDDQQLGAIGAGGVLRDIQASHGALRLAELVRFTDPAEGSASLALREGHPEALGFYLDRGRLHIGDQATMADHVFTAWIADRAAGLDSVMLAPTRDLVAQLNQRARTHRLIGKRPGVEIDLADGNTASAGDTIITRRNDRELRLSATDWVKNGDRWTVRSVTRKDVRAQHTQTGRHITLPRKYVTKWVELGYASTTHTAQGITADTCHGLLTGDETRQQAYTMLTRGRRTNDAYLVTVGDGDPHTLIHPDVINPPTSTDQLERILARDESPISATTSLRQAGDPAVLLGQAVARYRDAVTFAATQVASAADRHTIEHAASQLLPGITTAPAWPALHSQLMAINADKRDPIQALTRAAAQPMIAGRDPAAILAWRLDDTQRQGARGPLPWLNHVPATLTRHPIWGHYLTTRAQLVTDLAGQVRHTAETATSAAAWATEHGALPTSLIADIEVWRAATQIPATDRRPTGEPQTGRAASRWQRHLDQRITTSQDAALEEWTHLLDTTDPQIRRDPFHTILARRLSRLSSAGIDAPALIRTAARRSPLPDDHAAAALWWRISEHLTAAVAQQAQTDRHLTVAWQPTLAEHLGKDTAQRLQDSPWWPALVIAFEHGLQRGWRLADLLATAPTGDPASDPQAWVWRLTVATRPVHNDDEPPPETDTQVDDPDWQPSAHQTDMVSAATPAQFPFAEPADDLDEDDEDADAVAERTLAIEALVRATMGPPEPSAAELRRQHDRADAWRECPYTPERLAHINELTTRFYEYRLHGSWAQPYLTNRLRQDIAGHPEIRPGYAPDGWTTLVNHLRGQGITEQEMITTGVATRAATGRLIDRFRDRLVFPITREGRVLGFVARRNPQHPEDGSRGPKYLNTAETPLFHKSDQLYVTGETIGRIPVLVEGPLDAIAVTVAAEGSHVGVASLGTAFTERQAAQLASMHPKPIVATDSDPAGRAAAEQDYWLLTLHGLSPRLAELPDGADPADILAELGRIPLANALIDTTPLMKALLDRQDLDRPEAVHRAIQILAASPPEEWAHGAAAIAERSALPTALVRVGLAATVEARHADPNRAVALAMVSPTGHQVAARQPRVGDHPRRRRGLDRERHLNDRAVTTPGR